MINRDDVLVIAFDMYVDPASVLTPTAFSLLGYLFFDLSSKDAVDLDTKTLLRASVNVKTPAVDELLSRVSEETLARRCVTVLQSDMYSGEGRLLGTGGFLMFLNGSERMPTPCIKAGVHIAIMKRYWGWMRDKPSMDIMCSNSRIVIIAIAMFVDVDRSIEIH